MLSGADSVQLQLSNTSYNSCGNFSGGFAVVLTQLPGRHQPLARKVWNWEGATASEGFVLRGCEGSDLCTVRADAFTSGGLPAFNFGLNWLVQIGRPATGTSMRHRGPLDNEPHKMGRRLGEGMRWHQAVRKSNPSGPYSRQDNEYFVMLMNRTWEKFQGGSCRICIDSVDSVNSVDSSACP